MVSVQLSAPGSPAANPAFDITPARLVTGLITERGICAASEEGLLSLYPEEAVGSRQIGSERCSSCLLPTAYCLLPTAFFSLPP